MLLVLLFGMVDFGRVFQAGITVEAAARNGAEIAAQEYVQLVRNKPSGLLDASDYARLHKVALNAVCAESKTLARTDVTTAGAIPSCSYDDGGGPTNIWPLSAVCVHDGTDPVCGQEAGSVANCPTLTSGWDASNLGATPSGAPPLPYVEVRVCYQFTTLFNLTNLDLPFGWSISLGTIYLERARKFTVACYQLGAGQCD
jgi:TadE-like protein